MTLSTLLTRRRALLPLTGVAALTAVALLASISSAQPRQALNPVAGTQGFLVMTEGDAKLLGAENEGTVAVGGNLSFDTYQVALRSAGSFVVPPDANPTALVVGGRVNVAGSIPGSRLQVLQNGYVKIGDLTGTVVRDTDNNGAAVNTRVLPTNDYEASPRIELVTRQPVPSVGPASPLDFATAFAGFRRTATDLATCEQNVVLRTANGDPLPRPVPPGSNAVVTLTPGVTNVLNLTATDLANIAVLTFADQPTADTPLLVNVDTGDVGDVFTWRAPNFAGIGGEQARYILLNFPTATRLTLTPDSATVEGTIYAPHAELVATTQSNIEGNVISQTLTHDGGEIHDFPFSTLLNCVQASPTGSPTTPTASPTSPTSGPTSPTSGPTTPPVSPTGPTGGPTFPPTYDPTRPPHPPLPVTGVAVWPLVGLGSAAAGTGIGLLLLARQRRREES
ncbi:choice-of-anchor A family protein [Micromonospora auratinigra]|uniref:Choice-of-anchor A domain-containing protein n=1 Tax=Micromonospora auratinigra TaxID=261654 RepID=A0A1A8Z6N4_9ACTN|nr:choice-of-anchor A family protein [Micromonospora auratinigra]SBT39486.1 choice-of-anchor A domain-containing protein [Micromonospora auratinigra]